MRIVVTGGGTLDRKSSSVGGGFALDNVDNSASCGGGGRAIEGFNEGEWGAGRYLLVMKWSNTAIHPGRMTRSRSAARVHKTKYEDVKRGRRSHENGKLSESLLIRRKDTSLNIFEGPTPAQEMAEFTRS